jgi:lipopolysaccharide transport system permease protein
MVLEVVDMAEIITTYEPDNSIRKGYLSVFKEMGEEVRKGKWLTTQMFKRDFKAVYKQSALGIIWVLIVPLVTLGTFILLNRAGVFNIGEITVPYAVFALLGIAFWQIFAVGIQGATTSLTAAGSFIGKIKFPREALVVAAMGQSLIAFLIQMVLVVILMVYYGVVPAWTVIIMPFTLIPIVLLTVGMGFLLSIANGVARDIERGIGILTTFLMFATPILYVTPQTGWLGTITTYNPLFYLTTLPRDLVLTGEILHPLGYTVSVVLSVLAFFICWILFHLTETRIAERI